MSTESVTVGVISDTHGLVRPQALAALAGADMIVHAGDIGAPEVLDALAAIAPVTAVRGNVDREPWAQAVPETTAVEVGGVWLYLLHDLGRLDLDPAGSFDAVITGHSHQPAARERDGVLYFNPGSAGPKRFRLPVCVGRLTIAGGRICSEIIELAV
ncbi:metallophosphoesterase family protein [Haliangium sp.]|uniref:metallophosphoesterase family protein n=1 Tax=Haliangium sp. TaxID=2663208 RepID=UPI003D0DAA8D